MTGSTRVAKPGANNSVEVHLKRREQISRDVVDSIARLPSPETWFILTYNTQTGLWQMVDSFNRFDDADNIFVQITQNNGINADRLEIGKDSGPSSRVIQQ
jgi:hypothetical protein